MNAPAVATEHDTIPAPPLEVPYLAEKGCYSCDGTGKIRGFGATGLRCPCIASCRECGDDIAWLHDDQFPPRQCSTCKMDETIGQ